VSGSALTWVEQHRQLFDTVQNEMEMMYFVLFIIVIVAAFCVMNTMTASKNLARSLMI